MNKIIEIQVPDVGSFKDIPIIDILVKPGDVIEQEATLVTLESDKATMDIPSSQAGTVKEIKVNVGDKVSEGSILLMLEISESSTATNTRSSESNKISMPVAPPPPEITDIKTEILVLGAGPGGYTAAFRAADLGKKVTLVERHASLGGVCLNVGCIPSKTLLHISHIISEAADVEKHGVTFSAPNIQLEKIVAWKESVVKKLTDGLAVLAKRRKVETITGNAQFISPHTVQVDTSEGLKTVRFEQAIIAAGSRPTQIPGFPHDDPHVMDSTDALALQDVPQKLLIIGGGIIGLEMATVYHALGSQITIAEFTDSLIPAADKDIVKPLHKRLEKRYDNIYLNTKVTGINPQAEGLQVSFEGGKAPDAPVLFDKVLVAVGRQPNGLRIGAENAGIQVNEQGFITVDKQQRTNVEHIFAIGDVVGNPMLAHKAVHEGKVAAEVVAGHKSYFDAKTIPSVAYTDPELAWMGITETEAKAQGIAYEKGSFPWAASGRSLSLGRDEGVTKLLFDRESKQLIGAGIVGPNAGELIAEAVLGYELGADVQDLGLTIHPHPTLSETLGFAAELAEGTITDLFAPRRKPW